MTRRNFIKAGALLVPVAAATGQVVVPTRNLQFDAIALDWARRVVVNGGAYPSALSILAQGTFVQAMKTAGLWGKMYMVNCIAPDSLVAARTPLLVAAGGLDPWTQIGSANFAAGDLTVEGLCYSTQNKALDIGAMVSPINAENSGMTILVSHIANTFGSPAFDIGYFQSGTGSYFFIGGRAYPSSGTNGGHTGSTLNAASEIKDTRAFEPGYISSNRTASNASALYFASPTTPHTTLATNAGSASGSLGTQHIWFGAVCNATTNTVSNYGMNTASFAAVHQGLTAAQSAAFYALVNQLRTTMGGGVGGTNVNDWLFRIGIAGGARPADTTIVALRDFLASLTSAGILSKMITANCFVPDNLISAGTPLIQNLGKPSWTNNNFVGGDLTVNGLLGNGSSKYFDTSLNPIKDFPTDNNVGMTAYFFTYPNAVITMMGGTGGGNTTALRPASNTIIFDCHNTGTGRVSVAASTAGYYSGNRVASNDSQIYFANSGNAHSSIASIATNGGSRANASLDMFKMGNAGEYSSNRVSFLGTHLGLNSTESAALFNAIQALRTALGGGYI